MALKQVFVDDETNRLVIKKGTKVVGLNTAYNIADILRNGEDAEGQIISNASFFIADEAVNGKIRMNGKDGKTWIAKLNNGAWEITEND